METTDRPFKKWQVTGESPPDDEDLLYDPVLAYLHRKANSMGESLPADHEIATIIDDELVPVSSLKLRARRKTREYSAHIISEAGEHKLFTALTVAGLLLAAQQLRVHRKR